MKIIQLTPEEHSHLIELYNTAKTTPVIGFSVEQMIKGKDLSSQAWDRVRDYMDVLAKKYGYDAATHKVMPNGSVEPLGEVKE